MAETVSVPSPQTPLCVQEFIEIATPKVDPEDFETLNLVANEFAALNANKRFLVDHFNAELRNC